MRQRLLADGTPVGALALGALPFGTTVEEAAAFAILDRFIDGGGTVIDTANNYAFWASGSTGGESETMVGRWLASRKVRDQVVLSTKVGAAPRTPGTGLDNAEGLSVAAIVSAAEASLTRLGTDRLDVYWAHIEDRSVPLAQTVDALAGLVETGKVGLLGVSNHALWRVERARVLAGDRPRYTNLQYRCSYLQPRPDVPLPSSAHMHVTADLLDYVHSEQDLTLWIYSALLSGAYTRPEVTVPPAYDHPGTPKRLAALGEVADELGATANQVVLAWLMDHDPPMLPIAGVSSVAQLEELLAATDLKLHPDLRRRLNEAA